MTIASGSSFAASITLTDSRLSDVEESVIKISRAFTALFDDGVGANQINLFWQDIRTLAGAANEQLDLSPTPASGTAGSVVFVKVKGIAFWALPANTTILTVGRSATTPLPWLSATANLAGLTPGGFFQFCDPSAAGIACAAGTDTIFVSNAAGASASYLVIIAGTNA